jgi:hypothetical protein
MKPILLILLAALALTGCGPGNWHPGNYNGHFVECRVKYLSLCTPIEYECIDVDLPKGKP